MKRKRTFYPSMDSYRGRYLFFISLALIVFGLFSYASWRQITQASDITRNNIIERAKTYSALNAIINQIPTVKVQIYQYSLDPLLHSAGQTTQAIARLKLLSDQLDLSAIEGISPTGHQQFIRNIPQQLDLAVQNLISIRSNTALWIPSTLIISEQLLPLNNDILEILNSMLDELEQEPDSLVLQNQVLKIKNTWISIASDFRLIFANRFGFFGVSTDGMVSRQQNLDLLLPLLQQQLQQLKPLVSGGDYLFIRDIYLPKLQQDIDSWTRTHIEAIKLIGRKDWRKDIDILMQIERLMDQYYAGYSALRENLEQQSVEDIRQLNEINQSLSFFIIAMSLFVLLFSVVGYLVLDRQILRPIARTTRALKMQSLGQSHELNLKASARETANLVEAFNQMSEKIRQRENHLDHMAHHDALTKLPNRLLFNERLQHALKLTERSGLSVAVMLLDLDRFKIINDTLGHLFGDKLLQETAARLEQCIRSEDTVARLGGDEFAIIVENLQQQDEAEIISKKIIDRIKQPFYIDQQQVHISTSIGIACSPQDSRKPTSLIRYADIAMYQSKHLGGDQTTWFRKDLINAEQSIIQFENQLRQAITENQFEIHYQPMIDTLDPQAFSCEALLRWRHPERGLLPPEAFLGILDNSEILYDLTCWLIRESQQFQQQVHQTLSVFPTISINMPSVIFQQSHYREKILQQLLSKIDQVAHCVIEVTEDTLISDIKNTSLCLNKLHDHGFKIALDDFGTGQSSLSHLRAFPIDIIKIDKEFIRDVAEDRNDANLVSAIISLGQDLGLRVIAEGVETQAQLDFLLKRQCHLIQGFYFSEPLQAPAYLKFLKQQG